jgi:hypothetical protein
MPYSPAPPPPPPASPASTLRPPPCRALQLPADARLVAALLERSAAAVQGEGATPGGAAAMLEAVAGAGGGMQLLLPECCSFSDGCSFVQGPSRPISLLPEPPPPTLPPPPHPAGLTTATLPADWLGSYCAAARRLLPAADAATLAVLTHALAAVAAPGGGAGGGAPSSASPAQLPAGFLSDLAGAADRKLAASYSDPAVYLEERGASRPFDLPELVGLPRPAWLLISFTVPWGSGFTSHQSHHSVDGWYLTTPTPF